jgi:hypothetical protein
MKQRIENANGHCASYVGIPLGFTREELIAWVLQNPPPADMKWPSIDRIEPAKGYVPGNIRWLEFRRNCAGANRDLPDGMRRCAICGEVKPAANEYFPRNKTKLSAYCHPCNRAYQREWKERKNASV